MVYPALLALMHTPRLPVVDGSDAPAGLNGLVRFAERRNLVSARVPSHFKRSLTTFAAMISIFVRSYILKRGQFVVTAIFNINCVVMTYLYLLVKITCLWVG